MQLTATTFAMALIAGGALGNVISTQDYTCMSPEGAMALDQIITWGSNASYASVYGQINANDHCVPASLALSLIDQVVGLDNTTPASSNNDNDNAALEKRIRNCPEVKDGAISGVSKYSCDSTNDPSACRTCAISATAILVTSCAACAAKANQESLPCCVSAAAVFTTYYLKNCVHRF